MVLGISREALALSGIRQGIAAYFDSTLRANRASLSGLNPHLYLMHKIFAFLVLALLGACAQLPAYERPPLPVPNVWPSALAGSGREVARTHWRAFFSDPELQTLIAAALEHHRDLRIAVARVTEARAQYGIIGADQMPTVNLMGSASVSRTPSELSGVGVPTSGRRYDLTLSAVSFEVDFWGRLAGLSDAARRGFLATEEARRAVYLSLVADVASAYYTLLQMNELVAMAQSTAESREQSLGLISKARDLGGTFDLEVQQARGQFENSRAALASMEYQRTAAISRLNFLLGYTPVTLSRSKTLADQSFDMDLKSGLPAEVLLSRPDVLAAEQRLLGAHASIDAARAAFFPKVLLTAGLGMASQGLSGLFSGGAWSFQPTFSMPLFDAGRFAASTDIAEARKVIAVAEYEKSIQTAFRETADLLSMRASLVAQLDASVANALAQERRLEIAQARYNIGLVSYLEVLDGQRELVAAQQTVTQVRRAQLESAAQLYKALGGGGAI